jgi:drug/metabolite transporter (DMT)-like permease
VNASWAGALMVMLSAIFFSAKAVFAKLAYRYGADAGTVLTLRMAFALPFFVAAGIHASRRPLAARLTGRERLLLFALGSVGYYLAALFDFLGLQYVSASVERLILFLYPTLVVLMNAVFHRERIGRRTVATLALSYAGVGLVVWSDRPASGPNLALGTGLVFLGAIAYAFYLSFSQPLIVRHGSSRVTGHVLVVACLCALAHFAAEARFGRLRQPWQVFALCAAVGVVATVLPAYLLTAGIKRLGASRASVIGTIGPVATLLLAHWVLDEPITAMQVAGAALVIAATIGGNLGQPALRR